MTQITRLTATRGLRHVLTIMTLTAALLLGGCRSHRRAHFPGAAQGGLPVHVDLSALTPERRAIVEEAQTWFGTPYAYGEHTKHRGSDCSGMVLSVYLDATGIKLPRSSAQMAEWCKKISLKKVEPGDLVFFATGRDPDKVSHVGIMLDSENFIHVSTSKGVVISKTTTPYYTEKFMGFGRVPGL